MVAIGLDHVTKEYADEVALDGVDLDIADGEFFSIVGPSGCGKSTLLRVIAGLERPTHGSVRFDGEPVDHVDPNHREIAMTFQSYALYPTMTVAENIAFPLRLAKVHPRDVAVRVEEIIRVLGLTRFADRRPDRLSGGERQRVAMGRAIIRRPRALLMDEPLSNLDAALRTEMRAAIHRIHTELGVTTVYVTHDQVEAMAMADTVALMRSGRVVQCGPPLAIYDDPADVFAATFFGTPPMSVVTARLAVRADGVRAEIGPQRLSLGPDAHRRFPDLRRRDGEHVALGVRVDALRLDPTGDLIVDVRHVENLGYEVVVDATLRGDDVVASERGTDVTRTGLCHLRFAAAPSAASGLASWQPVRVSAVPDRVHLFDLSTGRSLRAGTPVRV